MEFERRTESKEKSILVVVAHPDDETIGMGGTIARHVHEGHKVFAISMTNGVGSRETTKTEEIHARFDSANSAAEILGFTWLGHADFPDNALDSAPLLEIAKFIEKFKKKEKFDLVYTHSTADLNVDHRIVCQAVLTAFRPQPNEYWSEIRVFETSSATDYGHLSISRPFLPNVFVNIERYWDKKSKALEAYKSELRDYPHSRSKAGLECLARVRGSSVGVMMAEAFEIVRKIER